MSLRLTLRSGSLAQWATAETAGNGRLRKGEIGVGWIEVAGTITEVVMRIGPSATPTAFSACPIISRSPLTAVGPNVKIPVVDTTSKTNSIISLSNGQFVAVDDDPGEYDSQADGGGVVVPTETPPAITSVELVRGTPAVAVGATLNLSHDGAVSDMSLRVVATGAPAPTVTARIESGTTSTNLVGTLTAPQADGDWTFPISLSSTATGLHVITITADSTVNPDAIATRNLTIVRAAAPAPVSIAITSLALKNDATNAVLTTVANGSGITLRADVTTDHTATTTAYQWRRGQTSISGATSQTYALVTADNDSNVSCLVTVTRTVSGQTATASATAVVAVGTLAPGTESGWTTLTPATDSRLIYVASNGNDSTAATAKGRGYYLPSDAEIGPDPTNPVGPIVAYATHFEAAKRLRLSNCTGTDAAGFPLYGSSQFSTATGFPDWILLKRGGSYTTNPSLVHPNDGSTASYNLGMLLGGQYQPTVGWDQPRNKLWYNCGPWRGRSASEPSVVTAWGPVTDPRPIVSDFTFGGGARHVVVSSLDLASSEFRWGWSGDGFVGGPLLVEDCVARQFGGNNVSVFPGGITFRRCVATGNFNPAGHNQGFFVANAPGYPVDQGHVVVLEECIFDRNGYKEDPNLPQTWTARISSALTVGAVPAGTGVQPTRTWFDRNLYLSTYADIKIRGCIISRGGGGGTVQMRQGGVMERNLFMFNDSAGFCASGSGGIVKDNLILHDDHMLPPGGWGQVIGVFSNGFGGVVKPNQTYVMDGNIAAHFHRNTNGEGGFYAREAVNESDGALLGGSVYILNNAVYREGPNSAYGFAIYRDSWTTVKVGNNAVGILNGTITGEKVAASAAAGGANYEIGSSASGGNKYWSLTSTPFNGPGGVKYTFAQWQASRSGLDSATTFTSDLAAFKTAAGWTAPERDIVSYMQSVDPSYVVNEDVYVDDDSTGPKQATRQKVWQVMATGITDVYTAMPEAQAKLTARRYHAFITFIQRAKANRKGAWDPRWTAEAVNNYVRDGFGKSLVSGAYTGTIDNLGAQYQ